MATGRTVRPPLFPSIEGMGLVCYDHGVIECGETSRMMPVARAVRKVLQSQALRYTALALVLPTLLVAPGRAGVLLLHRHCEDSSTHIHRLHHTDLDTWRDAHAQQHPCEGPDHSEQHEPEAAIGDADCDHDTPILVLPLSSEQLSRPLRLGSSVTLKLSLMMCAAVVVLPSAPDDALSGGIPPPDMPRADLASLSATAALLQRNHALLL